MNFIKAKLTHKSFNNQTIITFEFFYMNTKIKIYKCDGCLMIELCGRKKLKGLLEIFLKVYDLFFLMLGAYPYRKSILYNEMEIDTGNWALRYTTASHFHESEAVFCDISPENINSNSLVKMENIHKQSLSSLTYIVSEYYEHVVTNHKIELMTHTIDGFFMHSFYYKQLFKMKKQFNPNSKDTTYYDNVERVFKLFFYYHRKYNCEILGELGITRKIFYTIITDTRNDFSHLLGKKKYRLISGKDMVYYIDLIFIAERLFLLEEMLNLKLNVILVQEYLYIMHDWIDELVNKGADRIKSKRYKKIQDVNLFNEKLESNYVK